jgi:hypothetical protein
VCVNTGWVAHTSLSFLWVTTSLRGAGKLFDKWDNGCIFHYLETTTNSARFESEQSSFYGPACPKSRLMRSNRHSSRMTGKPEVISSPVGLVLGNALVISCAINDEKPTCGYLSWNLGTALS